MLVVLASELAVWTSYNGHRRISQVYAAATIIHFDADRIVSSFQSAQVQDSLSSLATNPAARNGICIKKRVSVGVRSDRPELHLRLSCAGGRSFATRTRQSYFIFRSFKLYGWRRVR